MKENIFEGLEHDLTLYSTTNMNPFLNYCSKSRLVMLHSHLFQALVLVNAEEKIVQTGVEREMAKHLFSKKMPHNARIINIIPRYRETLDENSIGIITEYMIIYEDLDNKVIRHINIPLYHSLHQYFGFNYKIDYGLIDSLSVNDIVEKGTPLALSPNEAENNGYKYGVNLNMLMLSIPEVSEDGFIISESCAKKLKIRIFERRVIEFGEDKFPLNLYGDEDNYKPFPDIGEYIKDSGLIAVLRDYDENFSPVLTSKYDVQEYSIQFDTPIFTGRTGKGKVIDIKVYHNPKNKKEAYKGTEKQAMKYAEGLKRFHSEIVDTYEMLQREYNMKYSVEPEIDPSTTRQIVESYVISDRVLVRNKIKKLYKNEKMDIYRVEITIEYELTPTKGFKLTSLNGDKGVIADVWPDEKMPMTKDGVRAEVISDPAATISRMNISRLYDQYFSGISKKIQKDIIEQIMSIKPNEHPINILEELPIERIQEIFQYLIDGVGIVNEDQKYVYEAALKNKEAMIDILTESIEENVYLMYNIEAPKKAYEVVEDAKNSIYRPTVDNILIPTEKGLVESKEKILIAPLYIMELYKIADTFLANASSNVNHFGVPISVSKANRARLPYRNSPVRILSESETRLYASYMDREAFIELKDRANSIKTHRTVYENILNAENPTNIPKVVDREKQPYGEDKILEIINAVFRASGVEMTYVPEKRD